MGYGRKSVVAPVGASLAAFPDFPGWFRAVLEDVGPSYVVAIARGAVRFLQLHDALLPPTVPMLSHDAMSFLSGAELQGTRVLLFDDSVIYGSTMTRAKRYLESCGALVSCVSYIVDRATFYGERPDGSPQGVPSPHSGTPLRAKHRFWPYRVRQHHGKLVRSILSTPMHYNLDFPTFSLLLGEFQVSDIPFIAHAMEQTGLFEQLVDVSSPISLSCGIPRYSGLLCQQSWESFRSSSVCIRPYAKLRFTFVPSYGEIRITPLVQLAIRDSLQPTEIAFEDAGITKLWRTMTPPVDPAGLFYHAGLHRLLTAFVGTLLGADASKRLGESMRRSFSVRSAEFVADDIPLILGASNAQRLCDLWDTLQRNPVTTLGRGDVPVDSSTPEQPNAPRLREDMRQTMRIMPALRPSTEELICESVGKLFLAMREATDSASRRQANPSADRLDTGLTYEGIRSLLAETGLPATDVNAASVSLAIDMCVDRGLAVPKIVHEGGSWLRAFYFGEGEDDQDALQFKQALHQGYKAFLA